MGDKFSDVGNAIKNFLTGVEDSIEGTIKGLLTLVADLGILYVYSECTQTVSGYVPEVLDQEVEKIKQKYEPLLKDPVNTIGGIGQSICDTADEKGVAYSSRYIVTEVVTALLADKGLDKLKNVAKTGKTADNVADIAEGAAKGAGNAAEDAGKAGKGLEEAAKGAESAAEDAGKVVESGSNAVIKNIQSKSPQQLIEDGWEDITNPKMAANTNSREFYDPKSGLKIRYDKGVDGENGFEAVDHYHVMNPNYTNKKVDYYLDIDGKPVGKGSKASHIVIKGEE